MKVIFAVPALTGEIKSRCHHSLTAAYHGLTLAGISYDEFIVDNCPAISVARNMLAAMFLQDLDATDLFFIDSDVGFDASSVIEVLKRPEEIVAGIYPLKRDEGGFPVEIETQDGVPMGRDGLIDAKFLPTGFMRIKRNVFEKLADSYPELKYESSVVRSNDRSLDGAYDFFGMGVFGTRFTTEDYAFCQRWRDIGGQLWVYPNVRFEHVGQKAFSANYHEYLVTLPGGRIAKAAEVPGWMSLAELDWLAQKATGRQRIVEIGSWMGRSTRALADSTKGTVWAVDTWEGSAEHTEIFKQITPGAIYEAFLGAVSDLTNVEPVKQASIDAALAVPDELDMVFIDGSHDYESVKADILAWKPKIRSGGLICGHDSDWKGVAMAVAELLPEAKNVPGTSIWAAEVTKAA
jgi:predicted O-methyltransferase YrrM